MADRADRDKKLDPRSVIREYKKLLEDAGYRGSARYFALAALAKRQAELARRRPR